MHRFFLPTVATLALTSALVAQAPVELAASRPFALMPRAITSFGADHAGGYLYVLGGYHGTPHEYSQEGQSADFYRMNLSNPADIELLPNQDRVQSVTLTAFAGRLHRVGGMRAANTAGEPMLMASIADAAVFDPTTATWSDLPALPEARSSHESAVVGSQIWVVGGWKLYGDSDDGVWHDTATSLDLGAEGSSWVSHPVPFRRRALGLAATSRHLVVVGGMEEQGPTTSVEVLDVASGVWTSGPDFPDSGFAAAATAVGDAVYASGREGRIWRLRIGEPAWELVGTQAFGRFFHRLVATPQGDVVTLGGIAAMDRSGRIRHVERFCIAEAGANADEQTHADDSLERVSVWTLPSPMLSKNRQGAFLAGRELYLFGGNRSLGQHDFERENFLSEGWRLDLAGFRWERLADYPVGRQSMHCAAPDEGNVVYALGGFGPSEDEAITHAEGYTFDLRAGSWEPGPADLPVGRSQFGLAHHEDALWVFGGLDYDARRENEFQHLTSVLRCDLSDPSAGFVDAGVELPGTRRAFGGEILDGRYYIVGGMREDFGLVDDCLVFDFQGRTFADLPRPRATRISPELVALDGRLYLAGGSSNHAGTDLSADPSIEVFDPLTGSWSVLVEALPFETRHMRMFALGNRLLIVNSCMGDPIVRIALVDPLPPRT